MSELDRFKQTFFAECAELLANFEEISSTLTAGASDLEDFNAMFRAVHSIKAGAGAFGFERLVRYTHEFENFMDLLRSGKLKLDESGPELLLEAGDILQDLVDAARNGIEADAGIETSTLARLVGLIKGDAPAGVAPTLPVARSVGGDFRIEFQPYASLYDSANEPQLLIHALADLGRLELTADISALPDLGQLDVTQSYLRFAMTLHGAPSQTAIAEIFEFVEGECDLSIERNEQTGTTGNTPAVSEPVVAGPREQSAASPSQQRSAEPQAATIRVDLDRIDRLVDMVGELVIAQSMALESMSSLVGVRNAQQLDALEDLTLRTRQLQEGVMAIRMQPLKAVFSRYPRIVRDLSRKLDKSVRLEMTGEATEVDKTIIEELADPLTHMIRNSIDHGIESPADRVASGKQEEAVIRLSAEHRNGRILIRVRDDGRGIDADRVLAKAISNGLVAPDAELSKEQIEALIFQPGFSTASQVSDLSGRGVGMDVVRRNIQKLGGRVSVESQKGAGTTFTLALPLTLAVLDGMLVSAGGQRYVVPLGAIVETVCPQRRDIRSLPDSSEVLNIRGEVIRLVDVARAFTMPSFLELRAIPTGDQGRKLVVICETEFGRKVGLVVDELHGQQQVVIKSIETNYRAIPGVSGTAILGDGHVRLILDVDAMEHLAAGSQRGEHGARTYDQTTKGEAA